MSIQDGGPAFPVANYDHMVFQPQTVAETKRDLSGMSLRDYFAAKYMQAHVTGCLADGNDYPNRDNVAAYAYLQADAMLAARSA